MDNKKRVEQLSFVEDPEKVKVLILTDQKTIYSDFYFISRFVNIIKLDLSYNKLSSFPVGFTFRTFSRMRTLFLHYNKFASIKSVQAVAETQSLQYLTLFGNPLEQTKTRHYFLNRIPTLKLMDDKIVMMQERNPELILATYSQPIKLTFPIIPNSESDGSVSFLSAVVAQLQLVRSKFLDVNPIVRLQRWYRKILKKRRKNVKGKRILEQIKIELQTEPKQRAEINKERLVTQKFQVHISHEQKLLSILQMNVQFLAMLREKSKRKVFALRQFCQLNGLKYETTATKLLCLRVPPSYEENSGKNHLQLIIKSSQKYLIRRKGSQEAMRLRNRYSILSTLMKKRKKRQPKYFASIENQKLNVKLSQKIQNRYVDYTERFVQIAEQPTTIYECMKLQFYKCLKQKKLFPFCLQQIMERSAAAVSIQRMWRGYLTRKSLMNSYEKITRNHAAWLIQRHIRNLGFHKRSKMTIQIADYVKKEEGRQLLFSMAQIMKLQTRINLVQTGINFKLPQQKVAFEIDPESSKICLHQSTNCFRAYQKYVNMPLAKFSTRFSHPNDLDILFRGAKTVKYFSTSMIKDQNSDSVKYAQKEDPKQAKDKSVAHEQNQVVVIRNLSNRHPEQTKKVVNDSPNSSKFVLLQFQDPSEALNRKLILALLTYNILNGSFLKSLNLNLRESFRSEAVKNINQRVNQCFVISKFHENGTGQLSFRVQQQLKKRQITQPIRVKFFSQQQDYTIKIQPYLPLFPKKLKTQQSLTLPLRQLSNVASSLTNSDKYTMLQMRQQVEPMKTAHISRNILTLYPDQSALQSSQVAYMSYREGSPNTYKKTKNRYDSNDATGRQKYLQKSNSLQPISKNESSGNFSIINKNLSKSYATEAYIESMNQKAKMKHQHQDTSYAYASIEEQMQMKKKKIFWLNDLHRQKLAENSRYKKLELAKLRQKFSDEQEQNNKLIQSSRLQVSLANARRHNMVKKALNQKLEEIKKFEKDFLKRGNSSIRKDLIKFEQERTTKSPDNESISESLKAIEAEAVKNHLIKRGKNIFHLKTEIKQFSIDGSEGDPDIGSIEMQSRSKVLNRKFFEQKSQTNEPNIEQKQKVKRAKSQKREMKKKKLVHSVFPEELYPLKETKRTGFQLPRINKK